MSRDGWAALPRGATGLSAVCDCVFSWSYSLTLFLVPSSFAILWHRVPYITTIENCIHHIRMYYTHLVTDPSIFHCISFGATLKMNPHFCAEWGNSNHFGGDFNVNVLGMNCHVVFWKWWFQILKKRENIKSTCITCSMFQGSWNCFISPNQSVVDQNYERNSSHRAILYQILNTGNFLLMLSIVIPRFVRLLVEIIHE